jgi:hypothetical protein
MNLGQCAMQRPCFCDVHACISRIPLPKYEVRAKACELSILRKVLTLHTLPLQTELQYLGVTVIHDLRLAAAEALARATLDG